MNRSAIRLYGSAGLATFFLLAAAPVRAQFAPRPIGNPPVGETYHIEGAVGFWSPGADIKITSESLGILGTEIDAKQDLGLTDGRFPELHLVLRPFKKHKLRFQYIPISYSQSATLTRTVIFNGQRFSAGVPVTSSLDWKAFRFGYEYDVAYTNRWYAGLLLDVKYTNVNVTLADKFTTEFTHAKAPIPAIGGVGRVYLMPNLSVTGELSGFTLGWLPSSVTKGNTGHYVDFDLYGTYNVTDNVGVQVGYRSFDVGYFVKTDSGSFVLKGLWLGGVVRY
ncbi:MAG: hypothetical protein ACM3SQ_08525 [Betaproteobacteria bacterium]